MKKVFAIGNIMMKDDGIAIHIVRNLTTYLEEQGYQVFLGETDFNYCLRNIENNDFLLIIDAVYQGSNPGTVSSWELSKIITTRQKSISAHHQGLLNNLHCKQVKGHFIGIEIGEVDFGLELSSVIQGRYEDILKEVVEIISCVK
ncbi:hydrogenase maturation protease [Desulfonispora thiosulfatigenes DSM 11270]|uniref:Hydrogenase maturation protease n=1 Tax=Desulfonispora thiosulfatigenes DSM 11270 TaxID=656914 RepID=A0A1W1VC35_DESTI|nr:hydrogenase maturation protease [Desulfonispora thiosulfatigenes]SMB90534.1 hydrogenase maturation protease [Desulfonispora thiosulfatigenes DSM 11270]